MPRNSIQREIPSAGLYVVAYDVGGVIVAEALEVAMIRCEPAIQDVHDLDRIITHQQPAGRFLAAITGMAFDLDPHNHGSLEPPNLTPPA